MPDPAAVAQMGGGELSPKVGTVRPMGGRGEASAGGGSSCSDKGRGNCRVVGNDRGALVALGTTTGLVVEAEKRSGSGDCGRKAGQAKPGAGLGLPALLMMESKSHDGHKDAAVMRGN